MSTEHSSTFAWHSIGGLGEVGMNCMVFRFGNTVLPVDAGILFADANDFGIESVFPDFGRLLTEHRPRDWIITHAHEDHIGAIPFLFRRCQELGIEPPLLHAPGFAAGLIREKLKDPDRIAGGTRFFDRIREFRAGERLAFGDVAVIPVPIRHSTPDSFSLAFEWKPGAGQALRIVHTADFKIDEKKFEDGYWRLSSFDVFGGEPLDLLFVDSTNSEREGHSVSETDITPGLENLIQESTGRVYVTLFSSNVYRMANLLRLARDAGRTVCLAGRSLQAAYRMATESGLFQRECPDFSGAHIVDLSEIGRRPANQQLIICSGSQGEQRSALMRMAIGQHPDLVLESGDSVIFSSKTIPGNEKSVSRIINSLLRMGAKVFFGEWAQIHARGPVHASGHARRGEIALLMNHLKPRHVVPVHGELRQLMSCAEVAVDEGRKWGLEPQRVHVVENGTELRFGAAAAGGGWELEDRSLLPPLERMLRFDTFVSESRDPFLWVRKKAASGGVVSATLDSAGRAKVKVYGVFPQAKPIDVMEVERWLASQFKGLVREGAFYSGASNAEESLADELARYVRRITGVRPFAVVHLVDL